MSAALATAEPTLPPDPDRAARPAYGPGRFAGLLRSVIEFGKKLGVAVRLRAQRPDFPRFTIPFGTNWLPDIIRRINVAISRALLLEERALQQAGLRPPPRVRAPAAGKTRAARQADAPPEPKRTAPPARPDVDPHYAGWPTTAQLAADISRRSVAAVLADICRDLGITLHHPLWSEMRAAITAHGGDAADLEHDAEERWCATRWLAIPFTPPPVWDLVFWPAPWSDPVTAAAASATGPP
jgi:hypothetical protein